MQKGEEGVLPVVISGVIGLVVFTAVIGIVKNATNATTLGLTGAEATLIGLVLTVFVAGIVYYAGKQFL